MTGPKYVVWCDGSIEGGNPGGWAVGGWILKYSGAIIKTGCIDLGSNGVTNNMAEYAAILAALNWFRKNHPGEDLIVRSDSQLIIHQLNRAWKCAKPELVAYRDRIWQEVLPLGNVTFEWVRRTQNREADVVSRYLYMAEDLAKCATTARTAKKFSIVNPEDCVIVQAAGILSETVGLNAKSDTASTSPSVSGQ